MLRFLSRIYLPACTLLLAAAGSLLFTACEDDFDANAPYREIPAIFGLLDAAQPVQYVKVNKAFLNTKTNALLIASERPDSSYLQGDLSVKLLRLRSDVDSSVVETFVLNKYNINNKEEGEFYSPDQIVYATDNIKLQNNASYKIEVKNERTGTVASAITKLVDDFCIFQLNTSVILGYYTGDPSACAEATRIPLTASGVTTLGFELARNAIIYKAKYIVHYEEHKNGQVQERTAVYVPFADTVKEYRVSSTGKPDFFRRIKKQQLFETLKENVNTAGDDTTTERYMGDVGSVSYGWRGRAVPIRTGKQRLFSYHPDPPLLHEYPERYGTVLLPQDQKTGRLLYSAGS